MTVKKSLDRPGWWMDLPDSAEGRHYLGVRDSIAAHIQSGDLAANACLPSERQLQTGTGAARGTVRAALFQLEAEGLIYRKERSGWYVSPAPIVYDPTRWEGFMSYVTAQNRAPRTELLSAREVSATPEQAAIFGLKAGAPLHELRRRRYVDHRAVLVETIFVDPRLAPGLLDHDLEGSLTQVLRNHYMIDVARNRIEMQPCALTLEEALALRVKSGLPGLLVTRISEDAQGRVVEYDQEYWRHDALKVSVDIRVG
ncbi:UTRA domain-containing protein [Asticcacaulis taihuensis]|uniref:DNA-binding transcriptional regulator, GntR family n=1 Tax=Asticcacaulis taihuensis TaxID=260084 RepID=A0A1G4TKU2_9CAUL|nr:UTRA domain-containing protein [Asticcacaulis taihuensis]SCW82083.1 DNA-binding transcriptional regulator, GntR family [Asticcacaulis taihuensis]